MFFLKSVCNFFQASEKAKPIDPLIMEINESLDELVKHCLLNKFDKDDLKKAIATVNMTSPVEINNALKVLESTKKTIERRRSDAQAYKTPNTKEESFINYIKVCDRFLILVEKLNERNCATEHSSKLNIP